MSNTEYSGKKILHHCFINQFILVGRTELRDVLDDLVSQKKEKYA